MIGLSREGPGQGQSRAKSSDSLARSRLSRALPLGLVALAFVALSSAARADVAISAPSDVLSGIPFEVEITGVASGQTFAVTHRDQTLAEGLLEVTDGKAEIEIAAQTTGPGEFEVVVSSADGQQVGRVEHAAYVHQAWLALLPALLAIAMALIFRQVILALFAGVLSGAFMLSGYDPLAGLLRSIDHYPVAAVADEDHAAILIFSLALGGMISVMTASGGARGLAASVTKRATNAARGQFATWLLGLVVFFDDYANSLLVGTSMRPITDKLRISREKLAFLVDATAAPVSSLALVSSWIGVEVAYIGEQLEARDIELDPYLAFLKTLPYRFYPWLMLVFGLGIVLMRRDFGPMLRAERRARTTGLVVDPDSKPASRFEGELPDTPPRAWIAFLSIGTVVAVALFGMYFDGRASLIEQGEELSLRAIFGEASSIKALLWAACAGGAAASIAAIASKALTLEKALDAWMGGLKSMLLACVILVLAWSLGDICKGMLTAEYVIQGIGDGLAPGLLPAVVFLIAAAVSFATGSSWGTMAILFPLVVPLADVLAPGEMHILLGAISSILAGSVFGDHCSPISDTTIMSSMASSCDHVDHVRTQLPYALAVGGVAVVVGELGTGLGFYPAWVGLLLGSVAVLAIVRFAGKPVDEEDSGGEATGF